MRRACAIFVCILAFQLTLPTSADAWWEYIEALKGPQLRGFHFEHRLFCLMEERRTEDVSRLQQYAPRRRSVDQQQSPQSREVVFELQQQLANIEQALKLATEMVRKASASGEITQEQLHALQAAKDGLEVQMENLQEALNFATGIGIIGPCIQKIGPGDRTRFSIDVGARYLWDNDFAPAAGHKVTFWSLEATFNHNIFKRPTWDVLDLGVGGGVYRFHSAAFDDFSGGFLDLRLDVHVPTVIRRLSKWTTFIPTGRVGLLLFPAGFDENAFAAPGQTTRAQDDEIARYAGFFFDLEPLCPPNSGTQNWAERLFCD